MPDLPKFQQQYVAELPLADTLCPICQKGYIKQGKYSPLCFECHSAFRISKYPSKSADIKETKSVVETPTKDLIIIEKLDEINDRLDKLAVYLKEKLEL